MLLRLLGTWTLAQLRRCFEDVDPSSRGPVTRIYDGSALEALLPHRYPFLLVDHIRVVCPGQHVQGLRRLSTLDVSLSRWRRGLCRTKGRASVDGKMVSWKTAWQAHAPTCSPSHSEHAGRFIL